MIHLFFTLLLGHLLGDFPLQTNQIARLKQNSHWGVVIHVLVYVGATALLLQRPGQHMGLLAVLGASHLLIDFIKVHSRGSDTLHGFLWDQTAHICCLVSAAAIVAHVEQTTPIGLLSGGLLYGAVVCALVISIMVMVWIWACTLDEDVAQQQWFIHWMRRQLLPISQRTGLLLFGTVVIKLLL